MRLKKSRQREIGKLLLILVFSLYLIGVYTMYQFAIIFQYHIPKLIDILESRQKDGIDASLNIAVVQALTNLTTLDDSHSCIIPHIDAILLEIRTTNIKQVKVRFCLYALSCSET